MDGWPQSRLKTQFDFERILYQKKLVLSMGRCSSTTKGPVSTKGPYNVVLYDLGWTKVLSG